MSTDDVPIVAVAIVNGMLGSAMGGMIGGVVMVPVSFVLLVMVPMSNKAYNGDKFLNECIMGGVKAGAVVGGIVGLLSAFGTAK